MEEEYKVWTGSKFRSLKEGEEISTWARYSWGYSNDYNWKWDVTDPDSEFHRRTEILREVVDAKEIKKLYEFSIMCDGLDKALCLDNYSQLAIDNIKTFLIE